MSRGTVSETLQESWEKGGYDYQPGDLVGQEGLERVYELYLRGKDGEQLIETNYLGQPINYMERQEPTPGNNLILSIDLDLQRVAEEALKRRIEIIAEKDKNRFVGRASAVVMDPNSGAILAMANCPSYDLNDVSKEYNSLQQDPLKPLMNSDQGPLPSVPPLNGYRNGGPGEKDQRSDIINCPGVIRLAGYCRLLQRVPTGASTCRCAALSCNIYFYRAGLVQGLTTGHAREYVCSPTGLKTFPAKRRELSLPGIKAQITGGEPPCSGDHERRHRATYHSITPPAGYLCISSQRETLPSYLVERVEDYQKCDSRHGTGDAPAGGYLPGNFSYYPEGMRRVTQSSPRAGTA